MDIYDLLSRKYGISVDERENPGTSLAQLTVVEIAPPDPTRLFLTIINLSANVVYVAPSRSVAATAGIRLNAAGGSITISVEQDFGLSARGWYSLASGVNSQCYVLAGIITRSTEVVS